jgi:hypothetical protein
MRKKDEVNTWHELLGRLIESPQERHRIAHEVGVQPITLMRWTKQITRPREENIRALLSALPHEDYQTFIRLCAVDYPGVLLEYEHGVMIAPEPPPEFYTRVLKAYAHTPPALHPHALYDLILQQIIAHLDPERRGMAVRLVRCVPPLLGNKVRSLLLIEGIGTPPWQRDLGQQMIFLGAESLAGAVVTHCRPMVVHSREESTLIPIHWHEHEQSVAAAPILWKTKIAGCLLISSAQPHVFSETHLYLLELYASLMALAFDREAFFDLQQIKLHLMPEHIAQGTYVRHFSQRVYQKMTESAKERQPITFLTAQELIWQEIEDELLHYSSSTGK